MAVPGQGIFACLIDRNDGNSWVGSACTSPGYVHFGCPTPSRGREHEMTTAPAPIHERSDIDFRQSGCAAPRRDRDPNPAVITDISHKAYSPKLRSVMLRNSSAKSSCATDIANFATQNVVENGREWPQQAYRSGDQRPAMGGPMVRKLVLPWPLISINAWRCPARVPKQPIKDCRWQWGPATLMLLSRRAISSLTPVAGGHAPPPGDWHLLRPRTMRSTSS